MKAANPFIHATRAGALGPAVTTIGAQAPDNDGHVFDKRGAVAVVQGSAN